MDNHGNASTRWGSSSVSIQQHWLLQAVRLAPAVPIHTTIAIELIGRLSRRALRSALDQIVARHRILRSVFRHGNGSPVSAVGPADRGFAFLEQDASSEVEVLCLLGEEARLLFDVSNGPLIRARLLEWTADHHFLLISAHPLVCDRDSLAAILVELRHLYDPFSAGAAEVSKQPAGYEDFVRHQFEVLRTSELQEQLSYWKRRLLGARDLMQLPTDRPRPPQAMYSLSKHRLALSEGLSESLKRLADYCGVSLLAVFLGGWSALLSRWSVQRDLTIGVRISSRVAGRDECVIGQFENILPVRISISGVDTVAFMLGRVDSALSAGSSNRDVPIQAINESLRPLRDGRPIVQTAISLSKISLEALAQGTFSSGELAVGRVWEERCKSALEMSISILQTEGRFVVDFEYAEDLFDVRTIDRVCDWWTSIFSSMAGAPDSRVGRLSMLTTDERWSVVTEFNSEYSPSLDHRRIDDAFESSVEQMPDASAVADGALVLSYRELNGWANQLARVLKRRGVRIGELIAVPPSPGVESIVAVIAVLKAGGAYIAGTPAEFRRSVFRGRREWAPRLFVVAQRAELRGREGDDQIIALDTDAAEIGEQSTENLQRHDARASDLACAVWRTDSGGERRWMLLEHRNLTAMLTALDERLHFTRFDVWSAMHSLASGIAQLELWGALLHGSQVTVISADAGKDPRVLRRAFSQGGVTVINQHPSEFLQWVDVAEEVPKQRLHTVILSGEPLHAAELKTWFELGYHWPQIVYLYGDRGLAIGAAYTKLTHVEAAHRWRGRLPVEPLSCCCLYVLDRSRQPVPIGVVGDIYVAGDAVGRSYMDGRKHCEWVPNPFGATTDSRLFKTGDRGSWTAGGQIQLEFRSDGATSNAETLRIESELLAHPAVCGASVMIRRNDAGEDAFVAHVEGLRRTPSPAELRAFLESNVPAYMVPKQFICQAKRRPEQTAIITDP